MKPVYLKSASVISASYNPQSSCLNPHVFVKKGKYLSAQEPLYGEIIPPIILRRMSRILKMAVFAGMDCLKKANIKQPNGIIAGTGRGNLVDTELFLKSIDTYKEEALTPTPFILSTYNSVCGTIALQTGATGYNQTFVQRGHSFEHALLNAQIQLQYGKKYQSILVGGFDEITDEYLALKGHLNYWKQDYQPQTSLLKQSNTSGTIAGEGAGFFLLDNKKAEGKPALVAIHCSQNINAADLSNTITKWLENNDTSLDEIDLLLLGLNGDADDQIFYDACCSLFLKQTSIMAYKHLCGEFETAGTFGIWLLHAFLDGKTLPPEIWHQNPTSKNKIKKILYYNVFKGSDHNFILFSR